MATQRTVQAVRMVGLISLLMGSACHKRPKGPSEHFDRGAAIHSELYLARMDEAYLDPHMDDAVAELSKVEADSVSAQPAHELLARIEKGRIEAKLARDAHARELAAVQRTIAINTSQILAAAVPAAPAAAAGEDAGAADSDPYGPGASIAEINKASGGCLVANAPFREEGGGKTGTTYKLAEDPTCRSKLPGFVNQVVLALDGRIYRRIPASDVKFEKVAETAPGAAADAGVASGVAAQTNAARASAPLTTPSTAAATPTVPNVAKEQDATPQAPPPPTVAAPVNDATPPPAQ